MIKDITRNFENVSINTKEISILKEHFPSCFKKDGSFDLERFKEELKDKVDIVHEGYELKFLGKSYAKLLASLDSTTVITPNLEHNKLPENKDSENIYISGDNLDGLKHLLKSYSKSVKCIYIDPPYNTGSDGFVYKDNFNFTVDELQDKLSVDETQAKRILDLTTKGRASHSAWLLFMYARLQLAKDLLKEDGVIFISIDDNEQANLKLLCDDVFGEENFVEQIIWRKKSGGGQQDDFFVTEHDYITCIARNKSFFKLIDKEIEKSTKGYNKIDAKTNKKYKQTKLAKWGTAAHKEDRPTMCFSIVDPDGNQNYPIAPDGKDGRWRFGHQSMKSMIEQDRIEFVKVNDEWIAYEKEFEPSEDELSILKERSILYDLVENTSGSKELTELLGKKDIFDNPKPSDLLYHLFIFIIDKTKNEFVLDFFSGSGSTSHAILRMKKDGYDNLNFIAIQINQELSTENKSQVKAYEFLLENSLPTTLDYLGFERIKRASKKIKAETNAAIDYGFKHFILNEPNQNTLDKLESFSKASLLGDATILDDFGTETVLTTWLNNDGYGLNAKVETIDLKGYMAYYCNKHLYLINPHFTQEAMVVLFEKYDTIAGFNPENIVLFGYSFNEWSVTEMLEKNLKILNDSDKNLKINIDVRY